MINIRGKKDHNSWKENHYIQQNVGLKQIGPCISSQPRYFKIPNFYYIFLIIVGIVC